MEHFWEIKHKQSDDYWLTGSNPYHVLKEHDIHNYKEKIILDIGVGKGDFAKEISKYSKIISVDISYTALDKINNFAKTYHISKLKEIEPVDLAICHLVFQHCDNETIQNIINDINLKQDGFFSFQFAYLREEPNKNVKQLINNKTHHFRTLEEIKIIINTTNKKILNISKPIHFFGTENISWYFIKVVNK